MRCQFGICLERATSDYKDVAEKQSENAPTDVIKLDFFHIVAAALMCVGIVAVLAVTVQMKKECRCL